MQKIAFPPIIDNDSLILLLGTMPSEESIRKQEYYGHKSNQFWKILFTLYNKPLAPDYKERVAFLQNKRIALWDVLSSCEGIGSADKDIQNEKPNDFTALFTKYPKIRHIFFTSLKAKEFYVKYIGFTDNIIFHTLPSPSPANARMNFAQKVEGWKIIFDTLQNIEEQTH